MLILGMAGALSLNSGLRRVNLPMDMDMWIPDPNGFDLGTFLCSYTTLKPDQLVMERT